MNSAEIVSRDFTVPSQGTLTVLVALLVVQITLAFLLYVLGGKYQPVDATKPLLSFDSSKISRVTIEQRQADEKTSKVVLQKDQQGWQLPDYFGFRASGASVDQLLNSLKDLKKSYPVTTTPDGADRFKLTAQNFEQAVDLYTDQNKKTTLYLGSSPSFRQVYAKTPDSNEIYTVEISEYQVKAKADDWIDRDALSPKAAEISSIDMEGFRLEKKDRKWALISNEKTELLHDVVAQRLTNALAQIRISSVLGTKEDPSYKANEPVLTCRLMLKDGKNLTYAFSKPPDKNHYVLKISDKPWYVTVDDWVVNRVKGFTATSLLKSEEEEDAKDQSRKESKKEQHPN